MNMMLIFHRNNRNYIQLDAKFWFLGLYCLI
uniref:Uncharacterized protein n=1 Tax=Rhizophora mucronata TaxID=61149 RepID=A0A2P2PNY0_RHIMU